MEKKCSGCKIPKKLDEFNKNKSSKDGLNSVCKVCKKSYYKNNREHLLQIMNNYHKENKEQIILKQKKRYQSKKDIYKENNKEYYLKHQEELKRQASARNSLNKDERKIYNFLHKERDNNYKKVYQKRRYKDDFEFKLKINLRNRFNMALKGHKIKSILKLIGCSIIELKIHIEKQFIKGMDWSNYGNVWEIDHIKGCINFDLTKLEEQEKCFNYSNLRPLFKTTEISKQFKSNQIGNRNRIKYNH